MCTSTANVWVLAKKYTLQSDFSTPVKCDRFLYSSCGDNDKRLLYLVELVKCVSVHTTYSLLN